jgi:hypothetical protein
MIMRYIYFFIGFKFEVDMRFLKNMDRIAKNGMKK